jgi:hypothetical protein
VPSDESRPFFDAVAWSSLFFPSFTELELAPLLLLLLLLLPFLPLFSFLGSSTS